MSTTLEDRRIGCILGAALADAAAQPVHWIYDLNKLDGILKDHSDAAFIEPSKNPFYTIPTGSQTCYGDQAYVVLKSLVECQGVNGDKLATSFFDFFGPSSAYEGGAGVQKTYPIKGPWRHGSLRGFLANYNAGKKPPGDATDEQIDGVAKLAPVVALYAGRAEMLQKVEEVARLTQNNDVAVAFCLVAARILEKIILTGCEPPQAVEQVLADLSKPDRMHPHQMDEEMIGIIKKVVDMRDRDHRDAVTQTFKNT